MILKISFVPSVLEGSIEQMVKLLDDSIAVTMKFPKKIKHRDLLNKLKKISSVKVVEKKLAAKSKFLWPFGGSLRSDKSEKDQIMISLSNDAVLEQREITVTSVSG